VEQESIGIQDRQTAGPLLTPREIDADEVHGITLPYEGRVSSRD